MTRLRTGILLVLAMLTIGCATTHREFRGTPEDFAILHGLPLPPDSATTEIKRGSPGGIGDLAMMDTSDKPVGPNGTVKDNPVNPDDTFLYIYLSLPHQNPADGMCWMDKNDQPPIDDELMVTASGPAYKVWYPVKYGTPENRGTNRAGQEFRYYLRDLPSPGTYTIDVVLLNNGGEAHALYAYCKPGYCGEFRICHTRCGEASGWCKNQQFTIVKP